MRRSLLFLVLLAAIAAPACSAPRSANARRTPRTTAPVDLPDESEVEMPASLVLPPAPAAGRLSLAAALAEALRQSPTLVSARQAVEVARGDLRSRSAPNNPDVSVGAALVPDRGTSDDAPRSQLPDTDQTFVAYTFPTSGSRRYATRSAQARLAEAMARYGTAELDLIQQVVAAYVDLAVAQEAIRTHEDSYRVAAVLIGLARQQVEAGAVPETNVLRLEMEQARVEQDLVRAQADRLVKEATLAVAMGRPPRHRLAAADPLVAPPPPPPLDELLSRALASRPELVAAGHSIDALRAEVDLARSQRRPDLSVQAHFIDGPTNSGETPYKAAVRLPLWDRGRIAGQVDRSRAELAAAEAALSQQRLQVELEVTRAYRNDEAARRVVEVVRGRLLGRADSLLSRARVAYREGSFTLLDVLDAQRARRQAALDMVNAIGEHGRARAALDRAVAGAPPTTSAR